MTLVIFTKDEEKVVFIFNNESRRVIWFDKLTPDTMGMNVNQLVINLTMSGWTELERRQVIYEPEIRSEEDEETSIRGGGTDQPA